MHNLPAQFVCWKLVQKPGKPKPDKVPIDKLGRIIDAHDPKNWMTYDEAHGSGLNVGFVFTQNDPYFFFDLDDCRVGDQWKPHVNQACQLFHGAAMEVSQSGDGIHIIGRCDAMVGVSRKNKFKIDGEKHEFYFSRRFVAFGKHGFVGDFNANMSQAVLSYIPVKSPNDDIELSEGADPEYTGPEDDEELLTMMLSSRGGLNQQFGDKATIRELWDADSVKLAQVFPSTQGDAFDRSAADAALLSHLAFWTGRDLQRMDRLFRRSGLMREKYEKRPEYREWTVTNAAKGCRNVYNIPRPDRRFVVPAERFQEIVENVDEGYENVVAGLPISATGSMTPSAQLSYFDNMVYVMEDHSIYVFKDNLFYPPERFSAFYGGTTFIVDSEGKKPTKSAFEAFTQNTCVRFPRVHRSVFRPDRRVLEKDGDRTINTYIPHTPVIEEGDVSLFMDHMRRLFSTERDMYIVLYWFATLARYPDKRIRWAPVIQGVEGNGKSFLGDVLTYIVGEQYTHKPNAEDISNKFNDYIDRKLLIIVEEAHMQGRREMMDVLKPLITNPRVEIQPKGGKKRMIDNWTRWIFFTNHKDAFPVDLKNRRYAIFYTRQQSKEDLNDHGMTAEYFLKLWGWFENGGAANLAHFLKNVPIPAEYDPLTTLINAPVTSSTSDAILESMGTVEQYIMEAIETDREGFKGGWISSAALDELLSVAMPKTTLGPTKKAQILRNLKYDKIGRAARPIFNEKMSKPVLYARQGIKIAVDPVTDYCTAQGYQLAPTLPVTDNVIPMKK